MPRVAAQVVEDAGAANVVALFLQLPHAAKALARRSIGVCLGHAGFDQVALDRVDVKRHLTIHLAIARRPGEERQDAAQQARWAEPHVRLLLEWRAAPA